MPWLLHNPEQKLYIFFRGVVADEAIKGDARYC